MKDCQCKFGHPNGKSKKDAPADEGEFNKRDLTPANVRRAVVPEDPKATAAFATTTTHGSGFTMATRNLTEQSNGVSDMEARPGGRQRNVNHHVMMLILTV